MEEGTHWEFEAQGHAQNEDSLHSLTFEPSLHTNWRFFILQQIL